MFRELTRKKQQLSYEECIKILKQEVRGVLAVNGDDNYPYTFPINYYYDESTNKIYFHSGKSGYKIDALKENNKVSFCVYDKGYHINNHWSLNVSSVIIFGKITFLHNFPDDLIIKFSMKFTDDIEYINNEILKFKNNTILLCLEIEHMTGKIVNES